MKYFRSAVLVAAVGAVLPISTARAGGGPLDPNSFATLGHFLVASGSISINTDTLAITGATSFTGVNYAQGGGNPDIAVFDFSSFSISPGVAINITGSRPLALLSRTSMTINSALNISGGGAAGINPGVGVAGGGNGGTGSDIGATGSGPGGGGGTGVPHDGGGGGFGGAGGAGGSTSFGGPAYGDIRLALQAGSGGGGGAQSSFNGGGGGAGGGAIELGAINTLAIAGITATGGTGGNAAYDGGSGSGGAVHLHGHLVSSTAAVNVNGGNGVDFGGGGGGGRIAVSIGTVNFSQIVPFTGLATGGAAGSSQGSQPGSGGFISQHIQSLTIDNGGEVGFGSFASSGINPAAAATIGTLSLPTGTGTNLSNYTWQSGGGVNLGGGTYSVAASATFGPGANLTWSAGTLLSAGRTLVFDGGTATVSIGAGLSGGSTLRIINGGLFNTTSWFDIGNSDTGGAAGSMFVNGTNSRIIAGNGTPGTWTDWARNVGDSATISISSLGAATYNSGLNIAVNGGLAQVSLADNGSLTVHQFLSTGGTGTARIQLSNSILRSTGTSLFANNTSITMGASTLELLSNATLTGNARIAYAAGTFNVGGVLTLSGTSSVELLQGPAEVLRVGGLVFNDAASINLNDNDMIIDYSLGRPISVADIPVGQRRDRGSSPVGLYSSLVDTTHEVGIVDNVDLNLTTFSGRTVDPTTVLVKFTYRGDANLDGQVDINDLARLASSWATSGNWVNGDFNYDGFVNINDLASLATNWQAGVGAPLAMSFEQALASVGLDGVQVPEPAALSLLSLVASALARRRRER